MSDDRFSFEGLNTIESRLIRRAEDIGYIVVIDRTVPRKDDTLGRFDFRDSDALPYLETDLPPEPDDGDERGDAPEGEIAAVMFDLSQHPRGEPLPMKVIAEAACRWIRDIARRNTIGETFRRFRVKVWPPKGGSLLDSGQFVCRNHGIELDLPDTEAEVVELKIPTPSFETAAAEGGAKGIRALGDYYAQWGQIVLGSVGQLQGVNNAMMSRLHRQLQESRDQVDTLVAAVLEFRFRESESKHERDAEQRQGDARHDLAREAIQQIGEAAKAFLAAKGITPEMADVAATIGQNADLVATLNDPDVRELMKDPNNLKSLAAMLKQVAAQARAVREAAANPPPANEPPVAAAS